MWQFLLVVEGVVEGAVEGVLVFGEHKVIYASSFLGMVVDRSISHKTLIDPLCLISPTDSSRA